MKRIVEVFDLAVNARYHKAATTIFIGVCLQGMSILLEICITTYCSTILHFKSALSRSFMQFVLDNASTSTLSKFQSLEDIQCIMPFNNITVFEPIAKWTAMPSAVEMAKAGKIKLRQYENVMKNWIEGSFIGSCGYIMAGSGLKELLNVINSLGKMLIGHAYSRALTGYVLVQAALAKLIF
ncbi:hypothetical protein ALC53_12004 [Atta colombica]|uniref:Uncharacterized protein n=1 Tax=Atta colombica TaxID=520822 RepID=A0A195AZQ0_9HYME|nr:hypothetical protein ALC53_12004 [Atta colombica]